MFRWVFFLFLILPYASVSAALESCSKVGCAAHWSGYEYDDYSRTCQSYSASGCSNPFTYLKREDCEREHPESTGFTCMAFWTGYTYDRTEGRCKASSASGCANPFEFQSLGQCEEVHGSVRCL